MTFFPLFARLEGLPCLVVGGGDVAARKARELAAAGARVTVTAPACSAGMREFLSTDEHSRHHARPFEPAHIGLNALVVAATADPAVNAAVAAAARNAGRLCNVVDDGAASTFVVPAVIERSPLLVAISSGGKAPALARLLRQQLERWLPEGLGALAGWAGKWRRGVSKRIAQPAARRQIWERVLRGPAAVAALLGDFPRADALMAQMIDEPAATRTGLASLVGAGPGDPGLITVRGLQAIEQADVVLHDRLVAPQLLSLARRDAEVLCVGKKGGDASISQDDINALLIGHVHAGRRVCRLKGGDPFIFGRGGEEALALAAAGLPFEVIPGVTAASGCAAWAGVPLTHRGLASAVTLLTASTAPGAPEPDWALHGTGHETLAVYMGGRSIARVAEGLVAAGRAPGTPAVVVCNGTTPHQRVFTGTLDDIAARCGDQLHDGHVLLIAGATAGLSPQLAQACAPSPYSMPAPLLALAC